MNPVGIVVEYNPFHNGHLFHASESLKKSEGDLLIAVMSGSFLQRGEPAIVPKHLRAEMALSSGVDLVFELPYAFATQHASIFAEGAIRLLKHAGCNNVCFGSEDGNIRSFTDLLQLEQTNNKDLNLKIKELMKEGYSYPAAAAESYNQLTESSSMDLSRPNNMLGYQYIKAIHEFAPDIQPLTIERTQSDYHDPDLHASKISSATSIRKQIFSGSIHSIEEHVPPSTFSLLKQFVNNGGELMNWAAYWPVLQHRLLTASAEELQQLYEMEEGIEHRLMHAAIEAESFSDFMEKVKTKRYTWTRIQRILTHLITNTSKEEMRSQRDPSYLRLLGMTEKGREHLRSLKKTCEIPIIANVNQSIAPMLSTDLKASRAYASGYTNTNEKSKLIQSDFLRPPVYHKKTNGNH
ncbi:nucleotidyltransferase [Jeotgalibacillus sp. R-1-5s-1]|uniref:nucleotidyltransferase n=1 Tax=Jeotgalibacillus sp. R-1-5s-1 TaxID=2555897 RepID=UPI00106A339A|nr:nucleotidyltransferase [Jeotgalibacillus sp. R-1-5s-1]TFE03593.1 nucleotidyltransferase [Jeotgalibacillus sp. R-1-5s-1]